MTFNPLCNPRSFYIHWPFCPYKCSFCPFVALAGFDSFMARYHEALKKEIITFADTVEHKLVLDTIYMGGGTPSTYPDNLLLDMCGILNNKFTFAPGIEFTLEVNPGTVRLEQIALWKQLGINRLSIGVQGLKDSVLKTLNRHQSAKDVYWVIENAHAIIENLSIDLILGLPDVNQSEWKAMLHEIVQLPIKHISVYFLTVHEGTPLYLGVKKKTVSLPCDDDIVDLFYWTVEYLALHGFAQYEISSYAKPGFESKHNPMYWDRKPFKAFGIGACEFDGKTRFQNQKNLMRYMESIEKGESVTISAEELTQEQVLLEKLMLGLRRSSGVSFDDLSDGQTLLKKQQLAERIAMLQENQFIIKRNERFSLTPKGLAVENDIVARLSM